MRLRLVQGYIIDINAYTSYVLQHFLSSTFFRTGGVERYLLSTTSVPLLYLIPFSTVVRPESQRLGCSPRRVMPVDTDRSFAYFPQLPTEIRLTIWELALHDPSRRVVIVTYNIDSQGVIRFRSRTRPLGSSALLYACSESRDLALMVYSPAFGDVEFGPPFPKQLRGTLVSFAHTLSGGILKGKAATKIGNLPTKGVLRDPHIYVDFSRDAIYFQQTPHGECLFDAVLRAMPEEQRCAIKVLGIDMNRCPMRGFESFFHLLCNLDEWVLFAGSAAGDARPPFANAQLSTVFFSEQKHIPGSTSESLERHIQGAFDRRRGEIEAKGGRIPKVKIEDHTNVQNQVTVAHRW